MRSPTIFLSFVVMWSPYSSFSNARHGPVQLITFQFIDSVDVRSLCTAHSVLTDMSTVLDEVLVSTGIEFISNDWQACSTGS